MLKAPASTCLRHTEGSCRVMQCIMQDQTSLLEFLLVLRLRHSKRQPEVQHSQTAYAAAHLAAATASQTRAILQNQVMSMNWMAVRSGLTA